MQFMQKMEENRENLGEIAFTAKADVKYVVGGERVFDFEWQHTPDAFFLRRRSTLYNRWLIQSYKDQKAIFQFTFENEAKQYHVGQNGLFPFEARSVFTKAYQLNPVPFLGIPGVEYVEKFDYRFRPNRFFSAYLMEGTTVAHEVLGDGQQRITIDVPNFAVASVTYDPAKDWMPTLIVYNDEKVYEADYAVFDGLWLPTRVLNVSSGGIVSKIKDIKYRRPGPNDRVNYDASDIEADGLLLKINPDSEDSLTLKRTGGEWSVYEANLDLPDISVHAAEAVETARPIPDTELANGWINFAWAVGLGSLVAAGIMFVVRKQTKM